MYFGCAIYYLVNSQQREVDSHQFDYRLEPAHRSADARADNSQFRNRSVAHTLLTIDSEQAVGDLERAAEVADFFAHDKDPLVAIEFLAQGLIQSFTVSDLRHRLFILRRVNALAEFVHRGLGRFVGELDRIINSRGHLGLDFGELRFGRALLGQQPTAQILDRVALLPDSLLALRAILRRIGHRMTAKAIG